MFNGYTCEVPDLSIYPDYYPGYSTSMNSNPLDRVDAVYFDMDGTIADLYSIDAWQDKLEKCDTSPYTEAEPLGDMNTFNECLRTLHDMGYRTGIVSWSSLGADRTFDDEVEKAKRQWCDEYLDMDCMDEFHVLSFGQDKYDAVDFKNALLVDDNDLICDMWQGPVLRVDENMDVSKTLARMIRSCVSYPFIRSN